MSSLQWDDLRVVLAVADEGSAQRAAASLSVRASTVSRRISAVEEALGTRLFDRLKTGYRPTKLGLRVLERAREMKRVATELTLDVLEGDDRMDGSVCLTAAEHMMDLLTDPLLQFARTHPEITLTVRWGSFIADVAQHEVDVAVRMAASCPPGLVGRRVADVPFGVFGSIDYLAAEASPHQVIGEDDLATPPNWAPASGRVAIRTNTLLWTQRAVEAGLGLARLPLFMRSPRLQLVEEVLVPKTFSLWVLKHERLRAVARVQAVTSFLADALSERRDFIEGR